MKKRFLLAMLLACPVVANAEGQGSGPNPYTECGIGAALFPTTSWAAVTSNAIWDLGSTAITSALSSPENCSAKKDRTARFVVGSLEKLEADIASGGGKSTVALSETIGCRDQEAKLVAALRTEYAVNVTSAAYASKSDIERATELYNSVKSAAAAVSQNCAADL